MKKNISLSILILFLIVVNGFFLYTYLGKSDPNQRDRQEKPMNFILKQLDLNEQQMEKMDVLNEKHHRKMDRLNNEKRALKDNLFSNIHKTSITNTYVDSVTDLIGKKEAALDKEAFEHFSNIKNICNDIQKEKFKNILQKMLRNRTHKKNAPSGKREKRHRPQKIDDEHRRPPRHE